MLLREHPRRQRGCRVTRQHRHHGLRQDRTVVQFGSHQVHRGSGHLATGINRPLVGMQTGKGGQQRRVDIDQAPGIAIDETGRQDAHKAGQHHQRRLVGMVIAVNHLRQRGIESLAAWVSLVVQHLGDNALCAGELQPLGLGLVADNGGDPGTIAFCPALALSGFHNGGHVGAAARDQNNDIFHEDRIMTLTQPAPLTLTPIEARVLGTLMEKARTVPDSYPLSLNSLMLGCNQKSSRDPVLDLSEADVASALANLMAQNLVRANTAGRVTRYEHNFQRGVGVPEQSAVLLGLLMLRGPQTAGELRLNTERWYKFADISSVEGFLEELQDRSEEKGGPLVLKLARAPGAREQRWAHLLCGPVDEAQFAQSGSTRATDGTPGTLARIEQLEAEVTQLQAMVLKLCAELGVSVTAA